ncbi:MAG: aerobic carbon-monoxide dehydrogenase medium subunit [Pseudonocardiales bacterium]|nr:aerobic carbon-monoxide dehydrogenase medium subunit [Pseudonocardiales bacterium]
MIPASFDYVRPSSIAEAVQAVGSAGEDAKVLAGGQSLLPVLRLRMSYPDTLIDLGGIAELRGVREDGQAIVIGSMTTHDEVTRNPLVKQYAPLLAQATATVGDRQVRHLGTFGGSLSHADPAGDLPTVALTLDAQLHVEGPNGSRVIAAKDFFLDYLTTALEPGEVLTAIRVPKLGDGWSSHYEKFSRVAQAWSIVSVAAVVRRDNGAIAESKIGLTNMGSTPLRATAVETALIGAEVSPEAIGEASNHAAEGTNAPSDLSGRADYRNHLAKVLTKRAVLAAAHR